VDELRDRFERRRRELLERREARVAELPVRFLNQTSHMTAPAANLETIKKAVSGIGGARRVLEKTGISIGELAAGLGVEIGLVESVLARSSGPSLVVVDSEDATALDPRVLATARANAVTGFSELDWGKTLAFYRPNGLELPECIEDLVEVIGKAAERTRGRRFPIDGVVWPKVVHEDELRFLDDLLSELERGAGLERGTIKVEFFVEAGEAVSRLPGLVQACLPRLAGVIFGIADYSADVGLPAVENAHPVCDGARAAIVNAAGGVGVPAIDAMTFDYPVRDPSLDAAGNKVKVLGALRRSLEDARHGAWLGMEGKWVGHPLQLLVNEIAFDGVLLAESVEKDVAAVRAYGKSVSEGKGAAMIGGRMADRATDRHLRRRLRKALAQGKLAAEVARELGIDG
jgi:citrate lyase subunit beta/citryl-CoA lyase